MSHTVPSEPAVIVRSDYARLRALLVVAIAAIVGLTIAVVLLATDNGTGTVVTSATGASATGASAAAIHANAVASQEAGARLDHSGRTIVISSGGGFAGAGARFFGPQQLRADHAGHH
jgi:hypothetical protein